MLLCKEASQACSRLNVTIANEPFEKPQEFVVKRFSFMRIGDVLTLTGPCKCL